jgi:penicillin-binding protein 1A
VGCDDRFIRLNKSDARGYGGAAAMPIWERFYRKVYADTKLGIVKDAKFSKPTDLDMEINSADPMELIDAQPPPGAEGEDQGVGKEADYEVQKNEYIGPESKPVVDEGKGSKTKKDSSNNNAPKIGEGQPANTPKKKTLLQKIFGKKEKKN